MSTIALKDQITELTKELGACLDLLHTIAATRHLGCTHYSFDALYGTLPLTIRTIKTKFSTLQTLIGSRIDLGDELSRDVLAKAIREVHSDIQPKLKVLAQPSESKRERRMSGGEAQIPGFKKMARRVAGVEKGVCAGLEGLGLRLCGEGGMSTPAPAPAYDHTNTSPPIYERGTGENPNHVRTSDQFQVNSSQRSYERDNGENTPRRTLDQFQVNNYPPVYQKDTRENAHPIRTLDQFQVNSSQRAYERDNGENTPRRTLDQFQVNNSPPVYQKDTRENAHPIHTSDQFQVNSSERAYERDNRENAPRRNSDQFQVNNSHPVYQRDTRASPTRISDPATSTYHANTSHPIHEREPRETPTRTRTSLLFRYVKAPRDTRSPTPKPTKPQSQKPTDKDDVLVNYKEIHDLMEHYKSSWIECESKGKSYYFNMFDKSVTWNRPEGGFIQGLQLPTKGRGNEARGFVKNFPVRESKNEGDAMGLKRERERERTKEGRQRVRVEGEELQREREGEKGREDERMGGCEF